MNNDIFLSLLNSKPLDVHKTSHYKEVRECALDIISRSGRVKRLTKEVEENMMTLLLDLQVTHNYNPGVWTALSMNRNNYSAGSRYNELRISYKPLMKCIDILLSLSLIDMYKGWIDRSSGKSFQTRIRATTELIDLMNEWKVWRGMAERSDSFETVLIKDREKYLLEYEDNEMVVEIRDKLQIINAAINNAHVDLNITIDQWKEMHEIIARDENKCAIDLTKTTLYRVFNNSNVNADWLLEGGRWYGGWWLELPSEYRRYITINNKLTSEIDFSNLHPRILYTIEGCEELIENTDIYDISGVVYIPTQGEQSFRFNVNTHSGRT